MKKCLHILPMNKLSGAEKIALIMCENMKLYKPIVLCGGENLRKVFLDNNIESYCTSFSSLGTIKTIIRIKNIIDKRDISVVHAHDNKASVIAYMTKKIYKLNIKIVSHIHNCYPWLKEETLNKKIDSILRDKYDYNIACGKIVLDYYKNNCEYYDGERTSVLSNCIDIDNISNKFRKITNNVKRDFNIPVNRKIIGNIGRLSEQKGIIPFIKELSKHKNKFKDSIILLVGNGEQEEDIKNLVKELELDDLFVFAGFQEDVYKFYNIIDVFFLPSLYEGLPMAILEAMAYKKAIVSMDVGSISEVINEDTGILVRNQNYSEFINSIKILKDNTKLINKYGENAYKYVKENFNINIYINKIEKLYGEL